MTGLLSLITHSDGTPGVSYSYNRLGQPVSVSLGSFPEYFTYNNYGELETEWSGCPSAHELIRKYDSLGRNAGYRLLRLDTLLQETSLSYDEKGRLDTVALDGVGRPWQYRYDDQSGLPTGIDYPNGIIRDIQYEQQRDLIARIHHSGLSCTTPQQGHEYLYDATARPVSKKDYSYSDATHNQGSEITTTYEYNKRGELIGFAKDGAQAGTYAYDNIGNRTTGLENWESCTYKSNSLNQYEELSGSCNFGPDGIFTPQYDADGNQTLVKTGEGIWQVSYDTNNRPAAFVQGNKRIECLYDHMGRMIVKTTICNGQTIRSIAYIYDGYLQIAEIDQSDWPATPLKSYLWDPSQPVATRPLALTCYGQMARSSSSASSSSSNSSPNDGNYPSTNPMPGGTFFYAHDALKNVTALYDQNGNIRATYQYNPFGSITHSQGDIAEGNPFRFSSEYHDDEIGLIYYNYRHYNPIDGRWINRDPIAEQGGLNLYGFVNNRATYLMDMLGLDSVKGLDDLGKATCEELEKYIDKLIAAIKERIGDMLIDHQGLYEKRDCPKEPGQKGTWGGHDRQIKSAQDQLRKAMKQYDRKGCGGGGRGDRVRERVKDAVERKAPEKPCRYNLLPEATDPISVPGSVIEPTLIYIPGPLIDPSPISVPGPIPEESIDWGAVGEAALSGLEVGALTALTVLAIASPFDGFAGDVVAGAATVSAGVRAAPIVTRAASTLGRGVVREAKSFGRWAWSLL